MVKISEKTAKSLHLEEAENLFILEWGRMSSSWGINRTMAQIHALLMISTDPLSADDVIEQLRISRGNSNMNLRELMNWGLVEKILVPGERREYFTAEKDIWKVARQVVKERKRRELEPMLTILDQLSDVEGDKKEKNVKTFVDTISGIKRFSQQADKTLDIMIKADESWFFGNLLKLFKS